MWHPRATLPGHGVRQFVAPRTHGRRTGDRPRPAPAPPPFAGCADPRATELASSARPRPDRGVLNDLGDGMPGMYAREREAPSRPVEREQAAIGDEGAGS